MSFVNDAGITVDKAPLNKADAGTENDFVIFNANGDVISAGSKRQELRKQTLVSVSNLTAFDAALGQLCTLSLTENTTIQNMSNPLDGSLSKITADAQGAQRTVSFTSEYKNAFTGVNQELVIIPIGETVIFNIERKGSVNLVSVVSMSIYDIQKMLRWQTLTFNATQTWNANLGYNANLTLTANCALQLPTGITDNDAFLTLKVASNASGDWVITPATGYRDINGAAAAITVPASTTAVISIVKNGSLWLISPVPFY